MASFRGVSNPHLKDNCSLGGAMDKGIQTSASRTAYGERIVFFTISNPSLSNTLLEHNQNELLEKQNGKKRHTKFKLK